MALPQSVRSAIAIWLMSKGGGSLRHGTFNLTKDYRAGKNSSNADLAAYLVARAPATFAAIEKALSEMRYVEPQFSPKTLLDVGAGPGTATWAALDQFPE